MFHDQLRRIREFSNVPPFELRALSERAHHLYVPKGRWLIQSPDRLPAYFYLLHGQIETFTPDQILRHRKAGPLTHFYPGCQRARTLSSVRILRLDAIHRDFVLKRSADPGVPTIHAADEWLRRFLGSHMMRQLDGKAWQTLLAHFEPVLIRPGCNLITSDTRGDGCYVIESGHAVVQRGTTTLAHLGAGDFCGEDAIISGHKRNADVTALDDLRAHRIDHDLFAELVLDQHVTFVAHRSHGVVLNIGSRCVPGSIPVALDQVRALASRFDPHQVYYVIGGRSRERALCAFLLVQRGIRAHPVED